RNAQGGEEAALLRFELLVERPAGDSSHADDVGHRRAPVAALGDDLGEGGHQPLPLMLDDEGTREAVMPTGQGPELALLAATLSHWPSPPRGRQRPARMREASLVGQCHRLGCEFAGAVLAHIWREDDRQEVRREAGKRLGSSFDQALRKVPGDAADDPLLQALRQIVGTAAQLASLAQHRNEAGQGVVIDRRGPRPSCAGLDQKGMGQGRLGARRLEQRRQAEANALRPWRTLRSERVGERELGASYGLLLSREEGILLALEQPLERRVRNTRELRDPLERELLVAPLGDELGNGRHDPVPRSPNTEVLGIDRLTSSAPRFLSWQRSHGVENTAGGPKNDAFVPMETVACTIGTPLRNR